MARKKTNNQAGPRNARPTPKKPAAKKLGTRKPAELPGLDERTRVEGEISEAILGGGAGVVENAALRSVIGEVREAVRQAAPGNEVLVTISTVREFSSRSIRIGAGIGSGSGQGDGSPADNTRALGEGSKIRAEASMRALRWALANQCRAVGLITPTPPIVGLAIGELKKLNPEAKYSPQKILSKIRDWDRVTFGEPGGKIPAVHLEAETLAVMQGSSKKVSEEKRCDHLDKKIIGPRLQVLINSKLAKSDPIKSGRKTDYDRYLTELGRKVFAGWPELRDKSGGLDLADEEFMPAEPLEDDATASIPDTENPTPTGSQGT